MRWIIGGFITILGLLGAGMSWLIRQLSLKANKESTDDRFVETLKRIDKHFDECREDKKELNQSLAEIHAEIAATKQAVAVLSARNGG